MAKGMLDIQALYPEEASKSLAQRQRDAMLESVQMAAMRPKWAIGTGLLARSAETYFPAAQQALSKPFGRGMLSQEQNRARTMQDYARTGDEAALEAALTKYNPEGLPGLQRLRQQRDLTEAAASRQAKIDEINANLKTAQTAREEALAAKYQAEVFALQNPSVTGTEFSSLDPDQWDQGSIFRFKQAERNAKTQEEKDKAGTLLLPAIDGYVYRKVEGETDEFGNQKYAPYPVGEKMQAAREEVNSLNGSLNQQKVQSTRLVEKLDKMIKAVDNDQAKTGIAGLLLQVVPGTGNYEFSGDLDTVLNNLGYNALMEAKSNSPTGASGFGQLSNYELMLLQGLVENLQQGVGVSKETLKERLTEVREVFQSAADRARQYTVDQYLGWDKVEPVPVTEMPSQQEAEVWDFDLQGNRLQ